MKNRIDGIEIHPLIGFDDKDNLTNDYLNAKFFETCEEDDENLIAWGVYVHREGEGIESVFDVPDKDNAIQAEELLIKLYNL
jgi:hypothetical protein